MSIAEEIAKLDELLQKGSISQEEYDKAKAKLLAEDASSAPPPPQGPSLGDQISQGFNSFAANVNQYCMFIHLSLFAGVILPGAGWVLPIVLWVLKKDQSEQVDKHGKVVINFMITAAIAGLVGSVLTATIIGAIIGVPLIIAVGVLCIVFPIMGGLKANEGKLWPYPLSFPFLKID
ncbi:MAG: DUF4870 domain-containing protein [Planctomycetota bacterium]